MDKVKRLRQIVPRCLNEFAFNPDVDSLGRLLRKNAEDGLRYLEYRGQIYVWPAADSTHGGMASEISPKMRARWPDWMRTGFIFPEDLTAIEKAKRGLAGWIGRRHAQAHGWWKHKGTYGPHLPQPKQFDKMSIHGRYIGDRRDLF